MKLRRLSLFSSGVGFFEHGDAVTGDAQFVLPFNKNAVNDVLKSLVINDPASSPAITYHAENTLERTMKGLKLDLQKYSNTAALLNSLKGAEVEFLTPEPLKGIIMMVEHRIRLHRDSNTGMGETYISLITPECIRIISLSEISGFTFTDPEINADAKRALSIMLQARDADTMKLNLRLPAADEKTRNVSLSYVIPAPVWKVSYRLDLSLESPFLQGWAIVDNDSDTDWDGVELALVNGRPVSFVQNLYAPYHLTRPIVPLSTSGIAQARTYDSGTEPTLDVEKLMVATQLCEDSDILSQSETDSLLCSMAPSSYDEGEVLERGFYATMNAGSIETASGRATGDHFEFTIKTPVTVPRHQSAMFPLVEVAVSAEKFLVYSPVNSYNDKITHPASAARLTNNTGMKLPAGAITVYDGGTYAGDSLITFFPEAEKRLISFGEDMTVTCGYTLSEREEYCTVLIKSGVMKTDTKRISTYNYSFKNASSETKKLILQHPINKSAVLTEPVECHEKTHDLYRFEVSLPLGETNFTVVETEPIKYERNISQKTAKEFETHIHTTVLPTKLQEYFKHVVELRQAVHAENEKIKELNVQTDQLYKEQERTRKNLEAAGVGTQQGKNYLARLVAQDAEIDEIKKAIVSTKQLAKKAEETYQNYVYELYFDSTSE